MTRRVNGLEMQVHCRVLRCLHWALAAAGSGSGSTSGSRRATVTSAWRNPCWPWKPDHGSRNQGQTHAETIDVIRHAPSMRHAAWFAAVQVLANQRRARRRFTLARGVWTWIGRPLAFLLFLSHPRLGGQCPYLHPNAQYPRNHCSEVSSEALSHVFRGDEYHVRQCRVLCCIMVETRPRLKTPPLSHARSRVTCTLVCLITL